MFSLCSDALSRWGNMQFNVHYRYLSLVLWLKEENNTSSLFLLNRLLVGLYTQIRNVPNLYTTMRLGNNVYTVALAAKANGHVQLKSKHDVS